MLTDADVIWAPMATLDEVTIDPQARDAGCFVVTPDRFGGAFEAPGDADPLPRPRRSSRAPRPRPRRAHPRGAGGGGGRSGGGGGAGGKRRWLAATPALNFAHQPPLRRA